MAVPDLINAAVAGPQLLGRGIAENVDKLIGVEPQPRGELWKPFYGSEDVLQALPDGLRPHEPQTAAGHAANLAGMVAGGAVGGKAIESGGKSVIQGTKNVAAGLKARTPEELEAAVANQKGVAGEAFQTMRDAGATFTPETAQGLTPKVRKAIASSGKLNDRLHGDTLSVIGDIEAAAQQPGFGLEDLHQFRQLLRDAVRKNTDVAGNVSPDGLKASQAIDAIDEMTAGLTGSSFTGPGGPQAAEALTRGMAQYAQAKKFEAISDIVQKAEGDPNKLTRMLTTFKNSKKSKGFTDDEFASLEEAARSGKLISMLGKFGFDKNNVLAPAVGGTATAGVSVPVGAVARYGQKLAGRGRVEELLQTIEKNSPVAPAVTETPPPPQLLLPAPATKQPEIVVSSDGAARPMNALEEANAIMARRRAKTMGLSPDVIAAQQARESSNYRLSTPSRLALPAPEPGVVVGRDGQPRLQTPAERDAAILMRQRMEELGLTPDVLAAQSRRATAEAMPQRGQSELGRWAAEQGTLPFTEENAARAATGLRQPEGDPAALSRMNSQQAFDAIEAEAAVAKQIQEEAMFRDNTVTPQQLVESAAHKYQEAGLPVGQVGEALLRLLRDESGSLNLDRLTALRNAASEWAAKQQSGPAILPIATAAASMSAEAARQNNGRPPITRMSGQPAAAIEAASSAAVSGLGGGGTSAELQPQLSSPLVHRIAQAESAGDPDAKNPNSTASGLLQFTNPTWQSAVAKWGKELDYDLKDKNDPDAQIAVGQKLMEANAAQLQKATGRAPTDGDQYAAWVFGPMGAAKLIMSQGSGRDAATIFPRKVVSANRSIFFEGKRPRSVEEVYSLLDSKVNA